MHLRYSPPQGGKGTTVGVGRPMIVDSIRLPRQPMPLYGCFGTDWIFDCGTVAGKVVLPLLARGVLGEIAERTAYFG